MTEEKGDTALAAPVRQSGNRSWWTKNTMSYDWKDRSKFEKFSAAWYDDIDRRFQYAMRLIDAEKNPFIEMMDLEHLRGMRVLEIGCGMGYHTELLLRAGANLTSIDISDTSIHATRRRLDIKGLQGDVRQMDAEALEFPDDEFDMVWSWGVIHHSSRTGRIIREIHRVLRHSGNVRLMVYHLEGMPAYITFMMRYALGFWFGRSLDNALWKSSDGFTARYYTRDGWSDLLSTFFDQVDVRIYGQDSDAVPLPRHLRKWAMKVIPIARQERLIRQRGSFVFSVASRPS